MSIYDDLQGVVGEVLGEFKQGVIALVQPTPGAGPAYNPGTPTEVTTTLAATARGASFKFIQNGLAVATDLMVVADVVAGITITPRDFLTIDGVKYKIMHDISVPAAGTKVAWKFIVRKGV